MKRLILLLTTLLFSSAIFAFQCSTNDGQEVGGGTQSIHDGPAAAFERKPTVLNPVATAITQQR